MMALRAIIQQLDAELSGRDADNYPAFADEICANSPLRPSSLVRRLLAEDEDSRTRYSRVGFEHREREKRIAEAIMHDTLSNGLTGMTPPRRVRAAAARRRDRGATLIAMHASKVAPLSPLSPSTSEQARGA